MMKLYAYDFKLPTNLRKGLDEKKVFYSMHKSKYKYVFQNREKINVILFKSPKSPTVKVGLIL